MGSETEWNYGDVWEAIAAVQPDHPAFIQGERVVTWGEFDARSDALAAHLIAKGLDHQAKLAAFLYNGTTATALSSSVTTQDLTAVDCPTPGQMVACGTGGAAWFDQPEGLTLGADPVATAMLHAAAARGRELDALVVRKAEKAHGLQRRIEGPDVAGRRVLAVEDTSTTGSSVLTAVDALREAGATVVGVAVIVERGAAPAVASADLPYLAAFSLEDLGLA